MTYGAIIKFPTKLIAFFPEDTAPLVSGMNILLENDGTDSTPTQRQDAQLPSGHVVKDDPLIKTIY
jgi:hypothetical protein